MPSSRPSLIRHFSLREFLDLVRSSFALEELSAAKAAPVVAVDTRGVADLDVIEAARQAVHGLPVVLVGLDATEGDGGEHLSGLFDVAALDDAELDRLEAGVCEHPLASVSLALLLRDSGRRSIAEGLVAESAVYSMLQAGPEFASWRAHHEARPRRAETGPAVVVRRDGDQLRVTLSRPHVHNAVDTRLRDQLVDALVLAGSDPALTKVVLDGAGPSFCSGGDLDEFGSFPDPATAHITRLTRSAGRLLAGLADRVEVRVHGACLGAGIELAAFATRVVAAPDTSIGLPEVGLGLVPGAGGTVSIPRRIGRQRTAWLALTGERVDAATALAWGLVDDISR